MSKIYGIKKEFAPVREDRSRIIIGYDCQEAGEGHCTWSEVYFYKKQNPQPSIEQIKEAVRRSINEAVVKEITEGFVWNGHKVWLSLENQTNYKNAHDRAVMTEGENLPVTFRFGSDDEPDDFTFEEVNDLKEFWASASDYILHTISAGREKKDSIDWSIYKY